MYYGMSRVKTSYREKGLLSPKNSLVISLMLSWSVFLQRTCNNMQWFNRFPLAVLLKYVLIRFIAENDRSLVALVASRTRSSSTNLVTSGNNIFWLLVFPNNFNLNTFVNDILLVSKKAANCPN